MAYHTDSDLLKRIEQLEAHHTDNVAMLRVLDERSHAFIDHMEALQKTLTEVRDRVMSFKDCPSPGMCIDLGKRIDGVDAAVKSLQTDRAIVVGGWKLVGVVAAGVIGFGTAAYGAWRFVESIVHNNHNGQ